MKKKLKDLTYLEMRSFCDKYYNEDYNSCHSECPMKLENNTCKLMVWPGSKYQDEEIEIKEKE